MGPASVARIAFASDQLTNVWKCSCKLTVLLNTTKPSQLLVLVEAMSPEWGMRSSSDSTYWIAKPVEEDARLRETERSALHFRSFGIDTVGAGELSNSLESEELFKSCYEPGTNRNPFTGPSHYTISCM